MNVNKIIIILTILLISTVFITSLDADERWLDDEIIKSTVFEKTLHDYDDCNYDKALDELQNIVNQYPGTPYAANALLFRGNLYFLMDLNKARKEYQIVIADYPNTKYWLIGRYMLIFLSGPTDESWLAETNNLIIEMGGKSIYEILSENKKESSFTRQQIAPQYQNIMAEIYYYLASYFTHNNSSGDLKTLIFLRENFPQFTRVNLSEEISYSILKNKNIANYSIYQSDPPPIFRIITPMEGASVREEQPRIEFELKSGDIRGSQVDLSKLQFTLDGQDLTEKMKIKSTIDTSAKPGVPFETLNIYYIPTQPLTPGTHTVYVKAVDTAGKVRQRTWTFQVI